MKSFREMWNTNKHNTHILGVPEGGEREKEAEKKYIQWNHTERVLKLKKKKTHLVNPNEHKHKEMCKQTHHDKNAKS